MLKEFFESIDKYQHPDDVTISKQRTEFASFKGYWIKCIWNGLEKDLIIEYDYTQGYTRVIGDEANIPEYTKGKHIRRDQE